MQALGVRAWGSVGGRPNKHVLQTLPALLMKAEPYKPSASLSRYDLGLCRMREHKRVLLATRTRVGSGVYWRGTETDASPRSNSTFLEKCGGSIREHLLYTRPAVAAAVGQPLTGTHQPNNFLSWHINNTELYREPSCLPCKVRKLPACAFCTQ